MNATERLCIICRTLKSNFNEEHIFPKTIGGGFKIYSVCYDCNKRMGDNIDTPFVNFKQILLHRHNYGLQRGQRGIKNPLKGKHTTNDGQTVIVQNDGEGFYYDFIPDMQIIETENGPIGKLTMAEKFVGIEEDMIKKYSKVFENKTGMPVGFHKIERITNSNPITITVTDSNNDFIFGCLKIAYETAVTCIPQYYDDELAIVYSKMLETGTLNTSYIEYINPKILFFEELINKLNKESAINNFHCAIAISNIESIGMAAVIKIFDMIYCLILSKMDDYIDDRIILFLNDSTKESLSCSLIKKISTFELLFDSNSFTSSHWAEMEQKKGIEENVFINAQAQIPLYNKNEEMISEHIMAVHSVTKWNIDFCSLSTVKKYNLKLSDEFFLKSVKSNLLYQLSEINFNN